MPQPEGLKQFAACNLNLTDVLRSLGHRMKVHNRDQDAVLRDTNCLLLWEYQGWCVGNFSMQEPQLELI